MSYIKPEELIHSIIHAAKHKIETPLVKTFIFALMAGAFVAFGAQGSSAASYSIASTGLAKVMGGLVFPVGLILIIMVGGQLFTSSCLNVTACWDKKARYREMFSNLIAVYLGNLLGASLVALAIYHAGQFEYSYGALGAYTIKAAVQKVSIDYSTALISGILCNVIVCLAVALSITATDAMGKIAAIYCSIFLFVISGFEHCVANMYYIPAGILASTNPDYVAQAMETYHITAAQMAELNLSNMFMVNLLPVTIGNIIGGAFCVGGTLYWINKK